MRTSIASGLLAFGVLAAPALASAQDPTGIPDGTVIGSGGEQIINGWKNVGGTLFQSRTFANTTVTEQWECCIAIFKKGKSYIIALTVQLASGPGGGAIAERVVKTLQTEEANGETQVSCPLLWIHPAISFVNEDTDMVRSIIYDGEEFRTVVWQDTEENCDYGD